MSTSLKPLTVFVLLGAAACASSVTMQPAANPSPEAAQAPAPTQEQATSRAEATAAAPTGGLSFSTAQADRGRDVFRSSCTECHYSSEFSDRSFKFKWRRRTAGDLFGHISSTMPEDAPGSLQATQYADLVAYILRMNGFEAGGGELPADEEALEALRLTALGND